MLSYFAFLAALNIAATTPTATPPPQLREIGHVRATAACAELATHANSAISSTLNNDLIVTQTVTRLNHVDLESDEITRHNALEELGRYAHDLRAQAVAGDREVRRLRDIAAKSDDPIQKKELKAFADTLGGALYRQKQIANDLNGLLAAYDYHEMAHVDESHPEINELLQGGPASPSEAAANAAEQMEQQSDQRHHKPHNFHDNALAANAARDFEARLPDITDAEAQAATHVEGAVSGC